ncbi:RnfH family protein [Thalassolituus sp.]
MGERSVFGKLATRETTLKAGARVEIYLPVIRVDEDDDSD